VIHRPRFRVDRPRALEALGSLGELLIGRLEELAAALAEEEALQRVIGGLVLAFDRTQQPFVQDRTRYSR
jgi:hypothetical protein